MIIDYTKMMIINYALVIVHRLNLKLNFNRDLRLLGKKKLTKVVKRKYTIKKVGICL